MNNDADNMGRKAQDAETVKEPAMFFHPMESRSEDEQLKAKMAAISILEAFGYDILNAKFPEASIDSIRSHMEANGVVNFRLGRIAASLAMLSKCKTAFFCQGWETSFECRIAHEAAVACGVQVLHETCVEFETALHEMKFKGTHMARAGWWGASGLSRFVHVEKGELMSTECASPQGKPVPWIPEPADIMACDWKAV